MGVNWSKDIDQTLIAAKKQFRPSCWTSARLRPEEPVLGWMPSRMKIRRLPHSSTKISFPSKLTERRDCRTFARRDPLSKMVCAKLGPIDQTRFGQFRKSAATSSGTLHLRSTGVAREKRVGRALNRAG